MATKFYIRNTSQTTPISPTVDSAWEASASGFARALANTSKTSDTLTTVNVTEATSTDKDICVRQLIIPLAPGQTVTGAQAIKFQCRVSETGTGNNMFSALGIRVIASDGSTVRKTVLAVTRDDVEAATSLTNRQFTATSAAGNYTTVNGDYLVIELGMAGDPTGSNPHDFGMRLGDSAASDLAEDDSTTTDNNPWVQLNDTLTVGISAADASASGTSTVSGVGDFSSSVTYIFRQPGTTRQRKRRKPQAETPGNLLASTLGAVTNSGDGSASGTGSANGVGSSVASGVGSASGTSEATGVSGVTFIFRQPAVTPRRQRRKAKSEQTVNLLASTLGASTNSGAGTVAGTGSVSGVGASIAAGVGSASGTSTAAAVSDVSIVFRSPLVERRRSRRRKITPDPSQNLLESTLGSGNIQTRTTVLQKPPKRSAHRRPIVELAPNLFGTVLNGGISAGVGSAAGTGTATGVGSSFAATAGSAAGIATITGIGAAAAVTLASASGISTVAAIGASTAETILSSSGIGSVAGIGESSAATVGSAAGSSTVTGISDSGTGTASASGDATVIGIGAATASTTGSALATTTVTGIGESTASTAGSASGTTTVTAVASSTGEGLASASGAATVTAAGSSVGAGVGSAAGAATVLALSDSATGIGLASGSSTVAGVGASFAASDGSSAAVSTVNATSQTIASADGLASGLSSVAAIGAAIAEATGSVTCISTVLGSVDGSSPAVGTATGTSTVTAVIAVFASAMGTSAGSCLVLGDGDFTRSFANVPTIAIITSNIAVANIESGTTVVQSINVN